MKIILELNGCCRSRKGAWIEIALGKAIKDTVRGRSREGAWIEILRNVWRC